MEKIDFIEKLKTLTAQEDVLTVSRDINELKSHFEDFCIEEERLRQVAFLEAQEKGEEAEYEKLPDPLRDEFYQLYGEYREKRNAAASAKKLEEEGNLRIKRNLIERLKTLIAEEENIGTAVSQYKEIHEHWKQVGDIARDKRQEVQAEYSRLLESFFHNLKIYRELKEHDLKRNYQLKMEVAQKIKTLLETESIKETESALKTLQNEFDEIGPVPHEQWEEIKNEYWGNVKAVYSKIHDFYEDRRSALASNIEKKKSVLEKATALNASIPAEQDTVNWEDYTSQLLALQEEWKQIGYGTKAENEEIWKAFRQECDTFFARKKAYFDVLRSKFDKVADAKRKIIEKALQLKDSTEWKPATDALLKLQKEWKELGHAGQRNEQSLWKEFRSACDAFFNAKQKHFEEADKANEINLQAKMDIIAKIEGYALPEDKKQALADLREFSAAFNAVGKVPFKEKDTVYNAYKKAIDAHYVQLKLEGAEKEKAFFQAKLDAIKAAPNAGKMIDRERRDMEQQIANLKQDVLQFENNLGFFAKSKGADLMKKEIEGKINAAKRRIQELQQKIKQLAAEE